MRKVLCFNASTFWSSVKMKAETPNKALQWTRQKRRATELGRWADKRT